MKVLPSVNVCHCTQARLTVACSSLSIMHNLGFDQYEHIPLPPERHLPSCPHWTQERRISCEEAVDHPWFREQPLPKDRALMPTFPATNDTTQQKYAAQRRAAAAAASRKGG